MCVHIILCLGIWTEYHLVKSFLRLRYTRCASGCMHGAAKCWSGQFASATAEPFLKKFAFVFHLDDEHQVDPKLYILDLLKPFRPSEDLYSQICSGNCGNDSEYAVGNPWNNCTLVEFQFGSHWVFFSYKYTCTKIHHKSWASSLLDRSGPKAIFPAR